ncbi:class D sortase [Fictibacillus iocasae]|uniref:Class D sortase n=1 Tax=Fictibacillus iocasae TaxID=2715437 RepID=A0ABW2NL72_9BACL
MKWLAYVLILTGIVTMMYPKMKSVYSSYQEKQLMREWENHIDDKAKTSFTKLETVFNEQEQQEPRLPERNSLLGTISIPKLDVQLPVLEGASQQNLKHAAGRLEGTTPIGTKGNTAIAAHRSFTYGKQFNRLNELVKNDEIIIETKDGSYSYTVNQVFTVMPDDISVLSTKPGEALLTLITCEPMKNPTKRLIVQAVLEQ